MWYSCHVDRCPSLLCDFFDLPISTSFDEFKFGRNIVSDEFREGCSSTAVVPTNIDAVRETIKADRHVVYAEIQSSLVIGINTIPSRNLSLPSTLQIFWH